MVKGMSKSSSFLSYLKDCERMARKEAQKFRETGNLNVANYLDGKADGYELSIFAYQTLHGEGDENERG